MFWYLFNFLFPAVTNVSPGAGGQSLSNDIDLLIAEKTLRVAQRTLVAYQFGEAIDLPLNTGLVYTATRYERLPLPYSPLSEGVAAAGEQLTFKQVNAIAQQWGDLVRVTDVADMTIKHPLFKKAIWAIGLQQKETIERNVLNILLTGTNVNYANNRAARANILATDVVTPFETGKIFGALETFGAPMFNGDEREDLYRDAKAPKTGNPHLIALIHPLIAQDLLQNSTISNALSYSNIDALYNGDMGEWNGCRFCRTNMMPYWTGVAAVTGTAVLSGGTLADATYYIQVTAMPIQTMVEQQIYQVSTSITVSGGGGLGSIVVTLPTLPGYVFNVYIGTSTSPVNTALCAAGPAIGPLTGQAVQLASGSTVVLTGVGASQTPPAAPATGVTVYPSLFFGVGAYGQIVLDNVKYQHLTKADKSDPLNQTKVISWKMFYGTIILNNAYMARLESGSAFSPNYTSGTPSE